MLARALPKSYISMYDQIGENERSALRHCNLLINWIIIKKEMWRSGPLSPSTERWSYGRDCERWTDFTQSQWASLISNLISNHLPLLRRKQYRPGQWLPHPRITVCLSSIPLQVIMAQRRDLWPRIFQFQRIPSSVPSTVPTTTLPQCSSASLAMVAIAAAIATADAVIISPLSLSQSGGHTTYHAAKKLLVSQQSIPDICDEKYAIGVRWVQARDACTSTTINHWNH